MMKKMKTSEICQSLGLNDKEIDCFKNCIKKVKEEQTTGAINAEREIEKLVEELYKNEI